MSVGEVHAQSNVHPKPAGSGIEPRAMRVGEIDEAAGLVAAGRTVSAPGITRAVSGDAVAHASGSRFIAGAGSLSAGRKIPHGPGMRKFRRFRTGGGDAM